MTKKSRGKLEKSVPKLTFTGERLIPEVGKGDGFFYEHLTRYLFAAQYVKDKIVLDAGCGVGYGSYILAKYGKAERVFGVDISKEAIEYAKAKYRLENIIYHEDNVERLTTIGDKEIEVAVGFELIEHLKKQKEFLNQIARILRTDGLFIVSTPNKYSYPEGNPFHIKELYPEEFYKLLKQYFKNVDFYHQGFELAQIIKQKRKANFNLEEKFTTTEQIAYTPPASLKKSQFLIAVCSNGRPPKVKTVSMTSNKINEFDLTRGIISLTEQFDGFKDKASFLQKQASSLNEKLKQKSEEASLINEKLRQKTKEGELLNNRLVQKTKEGELLNNRLVQKTKEVKSLENELKQKRIELEKIMDLVDKVAQEIEGKNKTIEELRSEFRQKRRRLRQEERCNKQNREYKKKVGCLREDIKELEMTIENIKSARFFRLWQLYCRIRKTIVGR